MEHVIDIAPSGRVTAMHSDKFPLDFLGPQKIMRASDIHWNEMQQSWGIWFNIDGEFVAPPPVFTGFKTYESAREFEVLVMNESRKRQVIPLHPDIQSWAISAIWF